ncbi:MAG: zf-HC2 domain-containing protein [Deltaproteobacteria bacterium]|nr:zf-HC2 domain-containing protein [Deltaproteobacteria bacterium]
MECREVETCADLSLDGEIGPHEQAELDEHIERCAPCRALVHSRHWYQVQLREKLTSETVLTPPPHTLRPALVWRIRELETRRPMAARIWAPAGLALAVLGLFAWAQNVTPPLDPEESVSFHTKNLPPDVTVRRDHRQVERFVRQYLRHGFRLPTSDVAQIRLVGARLSHIDNREAVQIMYDQRGARISLFAHAAPERFAPPPGFEVKDVHGWPMMVGHHRGYSVVAWHEPRRDVLYSLVSDVDQDELVDLAASFERAEGAR